MQKLFSLLEIIVVLLLATIAVVMITEVFVRDLFDLSLGIHEELTRYLMIWVAMLGSVLLTREEGHIRISLLPDSLGPRAAALLGCAADLVAALFLAGFVYACTVNLPAIVGQETITLGVGMVWFHLALPVGGVLMLAIVLFNLARRLRAVSGHPAA